MERVPNVFEPPYRDPLGVPSASSRGTMNSPSPPVPVSGGATRAVTKPSASAFEQNRRRPVIAPARCDGPFWGIDRRGLQGIGANIGALHFGQELARRPVGVEVRVEQTLWGSRCWASVPSIWSVRIAPAAQAADSCVPFSSLSSEVKSIGDVPVQVNHIGRHDAGHVDVAPAAHQDG